MSVRRIRVNFAFNLMAPLLRLAVAFVTVPIFIQHIGEARYGVMSIVGVLLGYLGFLDLGLSRASTNALAKLRDAPRQERARVLYTTFVLNCCLGLIGAVLLFLLGSFLLTHIISAPADLEQEIARCLPWIACLLPMTLVLGVAVGALESTERFLLANVVQTAGSLVSQIAPVAAALLIAPTLTVVIPAATMGQVFSLLLTLAVVHRLEGPFALTAFDKGEAKRLLGYGGWITVSSVVTPIVASTDQLVIGSLLGVAQVTQYSVPMNLVARSSLIPVALVRTFFPRISSLSVSEGKTLAARAFAPLAYGYAAACVPAIILAPAFFRFWIGADLAEVAAPVAQILFLGIWTNGLALVALTLLQAQGRVSAVGKLHLAEVVPFLLILLWLTSSVGIRGAACAWSLRCIADAIILFWIAEIGRRELAAVLVPALALCSSVAVSLHVGLSAPVALAAAAAAGAAILAVAAIASEEWRGLFGTVYDRIHEAIV